jgi:nitrite reductase/ring-hydroxylating ferredoxin subunit/DMSO/TMAO reductase YedYZ heme-binding membrane subunit
MSAKFAPISWTPFKKKYDLILWGFNAIYLIGFFLLNTYLHPNLNTNTIIIRGLGTLAILLLHFILWMGPASRFNNKLLPLLYNRRHLGVSMFLVAAGHGILSLLWFHGGGNTDIFTSLFTSNLHYNSLIYFPFQTLGFIALLIFAIMALTSHDIWLALFSPKFWKALHMLVYFAYALVIMHVALGLLQYETHPILVGFLYLGVFITLALHIFAAIHEKRNLKQNQGEWIRVCGINDLKENKAITVDLGDEKAAVFLTEGKISAVHSVCKHQMGPLGEGQIINGCITCPWHGFQYRPEDGCSPPPFEEKLATYHLRFIEDQIEINTKALPEGTRIEPLTIEKQVTLTKDDFFIGWDKKRMVLSAPALRWSSVFMIIAVVFGTAFSVLQKNITPYQINYQTTKSLKGYLTNNPFPNLIIEEGRTANGSPAYRSILLVDALKKGAEPRIASFLKNNPQSYVQINGYSSTLSIKCGDNNNDCIPTCEQCIYGTKLMPLMEIGSGIMGIKELPIPTIIKQDMASFQPKGNDEKSILGEIIDPKCYFGAMNPGNGKVHLSCAVRCIEGGIPPMIRYIEDNKEKFAILFNTNGKTANTEVINFIGLPIKIKGRTSQYLNWEIITIEQIDRN